MYSLVRKMHESCIDLMCNVVRNMHESCKGLCNAPRLRSHATQNLTPQISRNSHIYCGITR